MYTVNVSVEDYGILTADDNPLVMVVNIFVKHFISESSEIVSLL